MDKKLLQTVKRVVRGCILICAIAGIVMPMNREMNRVEAAKETTKKQAVYVVKSYKRSYKGRYLTAKYHNDLVQLKGSSKIVKKINALLKKEYKASKPDQISKSMIDWVKREEAESFTTREDIRIDLTKAKVVYNKKGYLSIRYIQKYYMGGVNERRIYSKTFDLKTGKLLTVADVISGNKAEVKRKIINSYLSNINGSERCREALEKMSIKDFDFYLKNGKVVVCFGPYQPGGGLWLTKIVLEGNYTKK